MGAKSMRRFDKHVRTCITSSAIEAESDIVICAPETQLRIGAGNAGGLHVGGVAEGTPWPLGQGAHDVMAKGHAPLEQQRRQPQERNGARLHWRSSRRVDHARTTRGILCGDVVDRADRRQRLAGRGNVLRQRWAAAHVRRVLLEHAVDLRAEPRLHAHGWHAADAWSTMVNAFEGMRRGQTDLDVLGLAAASCGLGSKRGGGPELPRRRALRRSPRRRKTSGLPRRRARSLQSQRACPIHEFELRKSPAYESRSRPGALFRRLIGGERG